MDLHEQSSVMAAFTADATSDDDDLDALLDA
jgi:hypothetical protein